jgi:hypothetical protein
MPKENVKQLVNHILSDNKEGANSAFKNIIQTRLRDALEARKAAVASQIYSKKDA